MEERSRERTERFRRKSRRCTVHGDVWGVQDKSTSKDRNMGYGSANNEDDREMYSSGLRDGIGMETYLNSPMDYTKTPKPRFYVTATSCRTPGPPRKKIEVYQ